MTHFLKKRACALGAGLAIGSLLATGNASASGGGFIEANNALYSTSAVIEFCSNAQQVIATTDLKASVIVYEQLDGFVGSDATPYRTALGLPFTNTSHVVSSNFRSGIEYVQGVLCKMKSADGINDAFPGAGAVKTDCAAVNQANYQAVLDSLPRFLRRIAARKQVAFDNWVSFTGQQWTNDAPAPFAYVSNADGKLHFVGKELYVDVNNPIPFIGPEKKGVDYCQVPSPEYIRALLLSRVQAQACDAPPAYSPSPFDPIPTWNCANP